MSSNTWAKCGTLISAQATERKNYLLSSTEVKVTSWYESSVYVERHYPKHKVKAVGSQLKLPYIAEGLADAYPHINGPLHLWDLAAGHAIVLGAGGSVTRLDGSLIDYHSPNLLVGDFVTKSSRC